MRQDEEIGEISTFLVHDFIHCFSPHHLRQMREKVSQQMEEMISHPIDWLETFLKPEVRQREQ